MVGELATSEVFADAILAFEPLTPSFIYIYSVLGLFYKLP